MNPSQAIARLKKAGMTEVAIAAKVQSRQSTINRIARGQMQPNWELGQRLVVLAKSIRRKPKPEPFDASAVHQKEAA